MDFSEEKLGTCGWHVRGLCVRMEEMKLEVECYSGRKADERPIRFRLDGHE